MLTITPQHRLLLAIEPVDFRRGIEGLQAMCQIHFQTDPFSGHIFIFRNRRGTSVKLLMYDGNGFWLCQKRFSQGKLAWWPSSPTTANALRAIELVVMLQQGTPKTAHLPLDWRQLPQPLSVDNSKATIALALSKSPHDDVATQSNNLMD